VVTDEEGWDLDSNQEGREVGLRRLDAMHCVFDPYLQSPGTCSYSPITATLAALGLLSSKTCPKNSLTNLLANSTPITLCPRART